MKNTVVFVTALLGLLAATHAAVVTMPPTTVAPATTMPPSVPTYTLYTCTSKTCAMEECTSATFNQGSCVPLSNGGSMFGGCATPDLIYFTTYPQSKNCTGAANSSSDPTNQCIKQGEAFIEFVCNGGSGSSGSGSHHSGNHSGSGGSGSGNHGGSGSIPSGSGDHPPAGVEEHVARWTEWENSKLQAVVTAHLMKRIAGGKH